MWNRKSDPSGSNIKKAAARAVVLLVFSHLQERLALYQFTEFRLTVLTWIEFGMGLLHTTSHNSQKSPAIVSSSGCNRLA